MEEIEIELIQEKEEQEIELMEETKDEQEISLENEPSLYGINSINDYEELDNKPQINNVELSGNKTLEELGIKQEYTANDITFEDGSTFQEKFDSGELNGTDGYTPIKGVDYFDGKDGYTPVKGVDYFDGKDGVNGKDGYTPVKGTDYFTEEDKEEIVKLVLNDLPSSEGVSY